MPLSHSPELRRAGWLIPALLLALALVVAPAGGTRLAAAPAAQAALPTTRVPDPGQPGVQYFAATGHTLRGPFQAYWTRFGGLAQFGYPITEEFTEVNGGQSLVVQYFERARFEHHPENAGTDYEVLLGALGLAFHKPDPPAPPMMNPTARYFAATGHNLSGPFRLYWEQHGDLFVNGYPTSEPFEEVNPIDGKTYQVQYFERARYELHPENAGTEYEVLLGLLGTQLARQKGYFGAETGTLPPAAYPRYGHAPDFSWIAGQVIVTRIQSGCTFVRYDANDVTAQIAPNGDGWATAEANNLAPHESYVVVFGHFAQPGEPYEMCPTGRPYIVDRVQMNAAAPADN